MVRNIVRHAQNVQRWQLSVLVLGYHSFFKFFNLKLQKLATKKTHINFIIEADMKTFLNLIQKTGVGRVHGLHLTSCENNYTLDV